MEGLECCGGGLCKGPVVVRCQVSRELDPLVGQNPQPSGPPCLQLAATFLWPPSPEPRLPLAMLAYIRSPVLPPNTQPGGAKWPQKHRCTLTVSLTPELQPGPASQLCWGSPPHPLLLRPPETFTAVAGLHRLQRRPDSPSLSGSTRGWRSTTTGTHPSRLHLSLRSQPLHRRPAESRSGPARGPS